MVKSCYIHIPFCEKLCSYCDFCKIFYNESLVDRYLDELEREISSLYNGEVLDTIYIGGGTPSCLNINQLKRLFLITDSLKKSSNVEFTFECNFSSTDADKLKLIKEHGINRLSFGLETTSKIHLDFLERDEDENKVIKTIESARNIGFDNINVDLMYALPDEDIKTLINDLEFIFSLDIEHVSCYSLIVEEHTKLSINGVSIISEELDYEMYNLICDSMKKQGYTHYEISNFAKSGFESKHNTTYWDNKEYYGFGLGSSSYIGSKRANNTRSIYNYLKGNYLLEEEVLNRDDLVYYEIMLNLRKSSGINLDELYYKYKVRLSYDKLLDLGLLNFNEGKLYIPEKKWYISNDIIIKLLEGVVYE